MSDSLLDDLDLENAPDLGPVEGDRQYNIRLVRLSQRFQQEEKGGKPYLTATMCIPDEPTAQDFDEFISFVPGPDEDPSEANKQKAAIKKFLKGFKLLPPPQAVSSADGTYSTFPDAVGAEARVVLGVKVDKRSQTNINFIKTWL